jgi:predicted DNA-binding protein
MSKSTVSTTVPREVKNQLDEKAESRDLTRSEIAREILESGIQNNDSSWIEYQISRNATTIAVIWIFSVLIGGLDSVITLSTGLLVLGMMIYSLFSYD